MSMLAESFILFLGAVFIALLIVQILFLIRVRRSLFQVNQFMKLMNLVLQEMANTHASTLHAAINNKKALDSLHKDSIRFNRQKVCQNCRHRLSYVLFGGEKIDFRYRCSISQNDIKLSDSCGLFEADTEEASQKN